MGYINRLPRSPKLAYPFQAWSLDATLVSNVAGCVWNTADSKYYAFCDNSKLYRRDGPGTWTEVATCSGSVDKSASPLICTFDDELFVTTSSGGVPSVFRLNGSSFTSERASNFATNSTGLIVWGGYLMAPGITNPAGAADYPGSKRNTSATWSGYLLLNAPATNNYAMYYHADFDFGGYRIGIGTSGTHLNKPALYKWDDSFPTYLETNVCNAGSGTRALFRQAGLYDGKCWMGSSNGSYGNIAYLTSSSAAYAEVATPSGYTCSTSPALHGANSKLYVVLKKTADSHLWVYSYDGSWVAEYDSTVTSSLWSWMASNSESLICIVGTKVLRLGETGK